MFPVYNRTKPLQQNNGVTLVELMIAVALIGIGILVSAKTYNAVSRAIQYSKGRTLASNIAQEKMQLIMQKSYYEVMATSVPVTLMEGSSVITYDMGYFPPETVTEGGVQFTRYTYIQPVIENSGNIQIMPSDTPDTGMRQITETVVWPTDSGDRFLVVQNVLNNPSTVMSNCILRGVVRDTVTLVGIPNALVNAAENIGWRDTTDAAGNYSINLSPGTYDFQATAAGYFPMIVTLNVAAGAATPYTFSMIRISSGTVKGTAWIDNHLVISQVVASTGPSNNAEYVELYNPTTSSIYIGDNLNTNSPTTVPVAWDSGGGINMRHLLYISSAVPANAFYLITNTGNANPATVCNPLTLMGAILTPDACWQKVPYGSHVFSVGDAGGFSLGNINSYTGNLNFNAAAWPAARIDSMAWSDVGSGNAAPAGAVEGAGLVDATGIQPGETYMRRLDTTTAWNTSAGNAYDTDNNFTDFIDFPAAAPFAPRTTATLRAPKTGTPATGAIVSVIDGLSLTSSATLNGIPGNYANPPYAQYAVPGVATGTWIVFIDSGSISAEIDTVTVVGASTTSIPNAATSPPWTTVGSNSIVLSTPGVVGMISGKVTTVLGTALSGIGVTAGIYNKNTDAFGMFFMRVSTGTYSVIANPGNANTTYASMTSVPITVQLGDVTGNVNFPLSQGGKITGYVTRDGLNPLPGVGVVALDINGSARDNDVTGTNGKFLLTNLTTGSYTVQTVLDMKETANPASSVVTVTAGNTIWSATFTVTGALGTITGKVKLGSNLIKSGVLVFVTTGTVPSPLPILSSNSLTSAAYYANTSREDGTYAVDVRGSTTSVYGVGAYYVSMNGNTPAVSSKTVTGVVVTAGQTTPNIDFTW